MITNTNNHPGKEISETAMQQRNTTLASVAALTLNLGLSHNVPAQEAPFIPAPTFVAAEYDPGAAVASFHYSGFVIGAYYMVGVQYDNLDPTSKFQQWSSPVQAGATDMTIVTDDPYYTNVAYYIIAPFQKPQSTVNFSESQTISNSFTFIATASTNIPYFQRQLSLGDGSYATCLSEGVVTNVLFATFDTQTRPNGIYYLEDYFVCPGIEKISGWETIYWNFVHYVDIENQFFAYYPATYIGLGSPGWTLFGTPGQAYSVTLSSVSADNSTTNLLASADISADTTTANGGGFSVGWDAGNDDGGPMYLLQVSLPGGDPVWVLPLGTFKCEPYCSWLHAPEGFNSGIYESAYGSAFGQHSSTADLLSTLYPADWGNNYAITQTKHPFSPEVMISPQSIDTLLWCLNITNASPFSEWYVSEFTAFGHMNPEEMYGGTGSPLTANDGFSYEELATARGTILNTNYSNSAYILSTKGALKCLILEGCESSGEDQLLFKAGGIPREDSTSAYPTWGMGFWWYIPVLRTAAAVGFCEASVREWVSDFAPTALDSVTAMVPWFPMASIFADCFGCMHSQYPLRTVSNDPGHHSSWGIVGSALFDVIPMTAPGLRMMAGSTTMLSSTSSANWPKLSLQDRPRSHTSFLSAPRNSAPAVLKPYTLPTEKPLLRGRPRGPQDAPVVATTGLGAKLAPGLWSSADFQAAIRPIRAEAVARRADRPQSVSPQVLEAVLAGQDYFLAEAPPMPPVKVNGLWMSWEDVYGPIPPTQIQISEHQREEVLDIIRGK